MSESYQDIWVVVNAGLSVQPWPLIDLSILHTATADQRRGRRKSALNNVTCMIDTETSKSAPDKFTVNKHIGKKEYADNINYIVAWSFAISIYGIPVLAIYGHGPRELLDCMQRVHAALPGDATIYYCHNLSYDYVFLRRFLLDAWGAPASQLATKPHYPVSLVWDSGIEIRDSLILAQCSLEKWAENLHVLHGKAVGKWDYDRIRNQSDSFADEEITYIIDEVLAGVECIDTMRAQLRRSRRTLPMTATGIPRSELRAIGAEYHAHDKARAASTYESYKILTRFYHGGYTHCNRWRKGDHLPAICFDFASSYPYVLLSEMYPCERFVKLNVSLTIGDIINDKRNAYLVRIELLNPCMRDYYHGMPLLQLSKLDLAYNVNADNGRAINADYVMLWTNEIELGMLQELYTWDEINIVEVWTAAKTYLPRWFTDYVYARYRDKTMLKDGDPVAYAIAKAAKLNGIYGMTVQHILRDKLIEDYDTGEYITTRADSPEDFDAAVKKRSFYLNYAWGCWVTSYALRNLYRLGACAPSPDDWLYSDTDSCYFARVDRHKINAYNDNVKAILTERGYGAIRHNGRDYWLGVAELDGVYHEFTALHSKCYAARDVKGQIKITVAGVPKKRGAICLDDDLRNFKDGFVFDGETTGKKTHVYLWSDGIYTDAAGNEYADSINLIPCDYEISGSIETVLDRISTMEVSIPYYGDDSYI